MMIVSALTGGTADKLLFVAGNIMLGFSEVNGALQIFAKEHFAKEGPARVGHALKVQLTVMRCSAIVSCLIGGLLYDHLNVQGVAAFGTGLCLIQLISVLVVIVTNEHENPSLPIDNHQAESEMREDEDVGSDSDGTSHQSTADDSFFTRRLGREHSQISCTNSLSLSDLFSAFWASFRTLQMTSSSRNQMSQGRSSVILSTAESMDGSFFVEIDLDMRLDESCTKKEMDLGPEAPRGNLRDQIKKSPSHIIGEYTFMENVPICWINYFVAFAVGYQSIMNGFLFGTASLLMFDVYGTSKSLVGVYYSAAAVSGIIASFLPLNQSFRNALHTWFPEPYSFYFFLFGCTCMLMLTALPYYATFMIGFLLIQLFKDLFVSDLAKLQGNISTNQNYRKLAPCGQMARRLSAFGILLVNPIFYDILPRLPNIVGSVVSFIFMLDCICRV
jgi:hypothetical protein